MENDYKEYLAKMIVQFRTDAISGKLPDLHEVTACLVPDEDNRIVRDFCVEMKLSTKSEFDTAMRRERVRRVLGMAPTSATELVKAFATTQKLKARFDGLLTREVKPTIKNAKTGEVSEIPAECRNDEAIEMYVSFMCDSKAKMNRLDLERELRVMSADYRLGFSPSDICDAVEEWLAEAYRQRLHDIFVDVDGPKVNKSGISWIDFAARAFDCSDTSPEFVAAVFQKFCWQVKRKMRGVPVGDHLMPVILGPQGTGKSTMVGKLLGPVDELKLNIDFQMVTDERNVEIWRSYVMFIDEMGYASKADIDTVKNIITASTLTRRPMRSNGKVTVEQNATLIGCANKELGQLIRDPTGIRRFIGLRMKNMNTEENKKFMDSIDWNALWGDVKTMGADPMRDHMAILIEKQEETRERSRVEQWMADCNGVEFVGKCHSRELYRDFRHYEDENYPGPRKTDKVEWDHEMNRLLNNNPEAMKFKKSRSSSGMMWQWTGEPLFRVVE